MKTHTTLGYNMCMKDLKLRPYADIPYEAQIIRVADEYDALVSKRQYKSHIGISDTLKIIIENSKPDESSNSKFGKNNPLIVRKLIKLIIEDTEYEIFLTQGYVKELKEEIKRLKQVDNYKKEMDKAQNEKSKNYYLNGMKLLLKEGETIKNYASIMSEYEQAYEMRNTIIENLYKEIKIMKKLKI